MSAIKIKDTGGNFIDIPTIQGEQGNIGPAGLGLPEGGTTGDLIVKNSNADYDTMWKSLVDVVYPIGSLYFTTSAINPSTLFGGTWEQIKDRFLLACGDIYQNGATGGEAEHTLTNAEVPVNAYSLYQHDSLSSEQSSTIDALNNVSVWTNNYREIMNNYNFSGGHPHNNMPPYLAVYIWKRIS